MEGDGRPKPGSSKALAAEKLANEMKKIGQALKQRGIDTALTNPKLAGEFAAYAPRLHVPTLKLNLAGRNINGTKKVVPPPAVEEPAPPPKNLVEKLDRFLLPDLDALDSLQKVSEPRPWFGPASATPEAAPGGGPMRGTAAALEPLDWPLPPLPPGEGSRGGGEGGEPGEEAGTTAGWGGLGGVEERAGGVATGATSPRARPQRPPHLTLVFPLNLKPFLPTESGSGSGLPQAAATGEHQGGHPQDGPSPQHQQPQHQGGMVAEGLTRPPAGMAGQCDNQMMGFLGNLVEAVISHERNRTHDEWPHYRVRDSKTPGGPPDPQTNFAVPIGAHPPRVDLRDTGKLPPVYDQGQLGSCTANALAAACHFDKGDLAPSRLFIYYNERTRENDVADDNGACLVDGCKSIQEQGVCSEDTWPYSDDKEQFKQPPPPETYDEAANNKATTFENVLPDHDHLKAALASGLPVVLAIRLYTSFESQEVAKNGRVPMPDLSNEKCLGGHAVLMVGYDEDQQVWIVRNSWGPNWGDGGYFYLPYEYICDEHLATDCWIIQQMA